MVNQDAKDLLEASGKALGIIAILFGVAIFFAAIGDLIH